MSKAMWLVVLQGIGITLQTVNAGIATVTHNAVVALIVCAVVGGYQFTIQHLGNQMLPQAAPDPQLKG